MADYVVCTAVQTYRTRYVIPVSECGDCDPKTFINDSVTCREVEEFSQLDTGEYIIDTQMMNEEQVLALFDSDNDYLSEWPVEQKLKRINNWEFDGTF
jgi:hypothetical protein